MIFSSSHKKQYIVSSSRPLIQPNTLVRTTYDMIGNIQQNGNCTTCSKYRKLK